VQYLLMIYVQESGWTMMTKDEQEAGMAAANAYVEALRTAGVLRGANRLQPSSTATTIRDVNGKSQVLDGPYADTKEQLGGFYLIEVSDLDAALAWAARCPSASYGIVEVRPVWDARA
jgi:hypothetical protein